jgi:MoxR-like ATPase
MSGSERGAGQDGEGGGQTARVVQRRPGLPAEVSSLVGRGPQIAAVLDGLRASRVVTLTGPGGCGKTRLALRAAALAEAGAVNPALTAMANAIRVGDHLLQRLG